MLIFSVFALPINAYHNSEIDETVFSEESTSCSNSSDTVSLQFETDKYHFSLQENIKVSYAVSTDVCVTEIKCIHSDFNIVNVSVDDENKSKINIELSCSSDKTLYSIEIEIVLSNLENLNLRLFAIKNEHGVFISPSSIDDANVKYTAYAKNIGILQEKEEIIFSNAVIEEIAAPESEHSLWSSPFQAELAKLNTSEIMSNTESSAGQINVSGSLSWEDDHNSEDKNNHPLRRVKVEIFAM